MPERVLLVKLGHIERRALLPKTKQKAKLFWASSTPSSTQVISLLL